MKKVLIAHQSTIPHYRIDFYNTLNELKPKGWSFDVVFDTSEVDKKQFFSESVNLDLFRFNYLDTSTYTGTIRGYDITIQSFIKDLPNYDVIVTEHAFNNLSYPVSMLAMLFGKKYVLWGHGKHSSVVNPRGIKRVTESLKKRQIKISDLYFAYTDSVKEYLIGQGIKEGKIISINNTIDIKKQRKFYDKYILSRDKIRERMGLNGKKILLFIGRINENKKVPVIVESFKKLLAASREYYLIVIGNGDKSAFGEIPNAHCAIRDAIIDPDKLAPYYIASDLFIFPGLVGLGPLQAMCYNLPVITIASERHMPEFAYLNEKNSFTLPHEVKPADYAAAIEKLFFDYGSLKSDQVWKSISHLTIENMAKRFIEGINRLIN